MTHDEFVAAVAPLVSEGWEGSALSREEFEARIVELCEAYVSETLDNDIEDAFGADTAEEI